MRRLEHPNRHGSTAPARMRAPAADPADPLFRAESGRLPIPGGSVERCVTRARVARVLWRYRIGACRVICRIEDQRLVVLVLAVGHRRQVYR